MIINLLNKTNYYKIIRLEMENMKIIEECWKTKMKIK